MPDREDAGVAADQPAGFTAPHDLVRRQARRAQLLKRDVAMLPRGERRDATSVVSMGHQPIEATFVGDSPPKRG